jgi:hypothetical protein
LDSIQFLIICITQIHYWHHFCLTLNILRSSYLTCFTSTVPLLLLLSCTTCKYDLLTALSISACFHQYESIKFFSRFLHHSYGLHVWKMLLNVELVFFQPSSPRPSKSNLILIILNQSGEKSGLMISPTQL